MAERTFRSLGRLPAPPPPIPYEKIDWPETIRFLPQGGTQLPDGFTTTDPNQHFDDPYHYSIIKRSWEHKQDKFIATDDHGRLVKQYNAPQTRHFHPGFKMFYLYRKGAARRFQPTGANLAYTAVFFGSVYALTEFCLWAETLPNGPNLIRELKNPERRVNMNGKIIVSTDSF
jgi:hypothetical protein